MESTKIEGDREKKPEGGGGEKEVRSVFVFLGVFFSAGI